MRIVASAAEMSDNRDARNRVESRVASVASISCFCTVLNRADRHNVGFRSRSYAQLVFPPARVASFVENVGASRLYFPYLVSRRDESRRSVKFRVVDSQFPGLDSGRLDSRCEGRNTDTCRRSLFFALRCNRHLPNSDFGIIDRAPKRTRSEIM